MPAILTAFFLSGFSALVYEILWVKMLSLFWGHTTVATSAVLSAFMAGLALGGFYSGKIAGRFEKKQFLLLYSGLELAIGILGLLSKPAVYSAQNFLIKITALNIAYPLSAVLLFIAAFFMLVLPCAFMGATFPLALGWAADGKTESGKTVGLLYGINTAGAAAGALLCGFILLPRLGMSRSLLTAAGINFLAAVLAFCVYKDGRRETGDGKRKMEERDQQSGRPIPSSEALRMGRSKLTASNDGLDGPETQLPSGPAAQSPGSPASQPIPSLLSAFLPSTVYRLPSSYQPLCFFPESARWYAKSHGQGLLRR